MPCACALILCLHPEAGDGFVFTTPRQDHPCAKPSAFACILEPPTPQAACVGNIKNVSKQGALIYWEDGNLTRAIGKLPKGKKQCKPACRL